MPGLFGIGGTIVGGGIGALLGNPLLGASIGGAIGGSLDSSRQSTRQSPEQFNPDPQGLIPQQLARLRNPNLGLPLFQRIAASGAPTLDQFLAIQAARGGSPLQAQIQFDASQQRATQSALDAAGQFQLGLQSSAIPALLGLYQQGQLGAQGLAQSGEQFNQARQDDFFNNLFGGLLFAGARSGAFGGGASSAGSTTPQTILGGDPLSMILGNPFLLPG